MYKRLKSPFNAQIEVTGFCTHSCQHCYNFWREKSGGEGSDEHLKKLRSEDVEVLLCKLAEAEVFSVVVTGGEPLMNLSASVSCVMGARSKGLGVSMNSNLTLMDSNSARILRESGLSHILTSILGPSREIHDFLTQRKGSFDKLMRGLDCARSVGINVSANMVVTKLNLPHIRSTAELVCGLGIKTFTATRAGCPGNCPDFSHLALDKKELVYYLNTLSGIKRDLGIEVDILEPIPHCGLIGVDQPDLFSSRRCCAGITTMTIGCDGLVRPCSHFDQSYGNLLSDSMETVWTNMDPWREGFQVPIECRSCRLFSTCGGGCRMEAKTRGGGIDKLDPYSDPSYVIHMAKLFRETKRKRDVPDLSQFRTKSFRLRTESFGGAVSYGNNKRTLLDHKGFRVLSQLKPNTVYEAGKVEVDWAGLDPTQFLSGLFLKGVIERR